MGWDNERFFNSSVVPADGTIDLGTSAKPFDDVYADRFHGDGAAITAVDHGNCAGRSDDDHTQYHTDARGDVRYHTKSQITTISGDIVNQIPTSYISDAEMTVISGDIVNQIPSLAGYATDAEVTVISGDIIAQIPTDYISDSEMTTISGDIVNQIPSLAGYLTTAQFTTSSGDIVNQIPTDYISDGEMTTISGDIVGQIPSLAGYLTTASFTTSSGDIVNQIPSDYISDGEMTTISGDIVGQIPSLAGYLTTAQFTTSSGDIVNQIPSDYISDSEMTTISGDIVNQIPSLSGYATDAEVTVISGDIMAQVLKKDGSVALTGHLLPNASGTINLGSEAMPFGDIYTVSGTIYMDGQEVLSMSAGIVTVGGVSVANLTTMVTGAYTGDGSTSKAITGVGGQPKRIELFCSDDGSNFDSAGNVTKFLWFSGMATTNMLSVELGTQLTGRLVSVDSDGFTISDNSDDSPPNQNGKKCKYIAWY